MKVLITGATGFLGSHLCRVMVAEGFDLRILCRPTSSIETLSGIRFEKTLGDITDPQSLRLAMKGCDYVVHAAAISGFRSGDPKQQMQVNVDGTRHVAQAALRASVKRLLHVSSVAAIGVSGDPERPADEEFRFNLTNLGWTYHLSKSRAEAAVLAEQERGLNAVTVNPSVICGPAPDGYRVVEPMKKVLRRWFIPYTAGGLCLVHIDDVIQGILLALRKGQNGNRYILGGSNVSFKEMIEAERKEFRLPRLLIPVPPILAEAKGKLTNELRRLRGYESTPEFDRRVRFQFYSSRKAMVELGYRPRDFVAIIREFVAYQRAESLKNGTQQPELLSVGHPDQLGLKDAGRDGEIRI